MGGTTPSSGGQVWLGDTELTALRDDQLTRVRRERIGFVFQAFNLLPVLDARETGQTVAVRALGAVARRRRRLSGVDPWA